MPSRKPSQTALPTDTDASEASAPAAQPTLSRNASDLLSLRDAGAMRRRLDVLTGAKLEAQAKAAQEAQALVIETKAAIDSARLRLQEAERALLRVGSQENSNALTEAQAALTMSEQRHTLAVREAGNASAGLTSAIAAERDTVVEAVLSEVASAAQQSDVMGMAASISDAIHEAAQIVRAAIAPVVEAESKRKRLVLDMLMLASAADIDPQAHPIFRGLVDRGGYPASVDLDHMIAPAHEEVVRRLRADGADVETLAQWFALPVASPWGR